jgi:hypothetical protein
MLKAFWYERYAVKKHSFIREEKGKKKGRKREARHAKLCQEVDKKSTIIKDME